MYIRLNYRRGQWIVVKTWTAKKFRAVVEIGDSRARFKIIGGEIFLISINKFFGIQFVRIQRRTVTTGLFVEGNHKNRKKKKTKVKVLIIEKPAWRSVDVVGGLARDVTHINTTPGESTDAVAPAPIASRTLVMVNQTAGCLYTHTHAHCCIL